MNEWKAIPWDMSEDGCVQMYGQHCYCQPKVFEHEGDVIKGPYGACCRCGAWYVGWVQPHA